jgi:hypothetical protein
MAYTNAPTQSTYSSERISLCQAPWPIYNSYKTMWNLVPHKAPDESMYAKSRYMITDGTAVGNVDTNGVVCRGMYVWEKVPGGITYYYMVVGTSVYTATSLTGTWTAVTTLSTNATTPVRFTEFINDTNTKSLILVDGVEGYVFTTNAAGTKITDADFPSPHVPFPVFLDGYLFLAKAGTGDIYNSDLNSPASWTAGSFISSEIYPDDIQALVKINNYILAIGTHGSEYFYDAANATGSPLARYDGQVIPFGTTLPNTVASTNDKCCFVGTDGSGGYCLRIVEDFKYQDIDAPVLISHLAGITTTTQATALRAYFVNQYGKAQYVLAQDGTHNGDSYTTFKYSLAFDFATGIWSMYSRGNSTASTYGTQAHKTFPVYFAVRGPSTDDGPVVAGMAQNVAFIGRLSADSPTGKDNIPINSTTSTNHFYLNVVPTPFNDYGTINYKFMSRASVDYSVLGEDGSANSDGSLVPRVSWIDSPSTLNYSNQRMLVGGYYTNTSNNSYGLDAPYITQLGAFRRRSLCVESYGAVLFNNLEVDINKGQQ